MFKRLIPALAGLLALAGIAHAAGTVPGFSLTPQFDLSGKVMPGCKLFVIQAGTVSTPQQPFQDSGLSILAPNPLTCDASGRIPQFFLADGTIKLRLQNSAGVQIFTGDNILVVGASSGGGGGGGTVDPTTILSTGDFKLNYGTGILSGFVRANGRTIGSATSGATERANLDCQALFQYLWGADANLTVSGGRGVSAAADYAATAKPSLCRIWPADLAWMTLGGGFKGRLNFANSTVLGASGGASSYTILNTNLPPYTPSGTIANGAISIAANAGGGPIIVGNAAKSGNVGTGADVVPVGSGGATVTQATTTFTGTAQGGAAHHSASSTR